MTNTLARRHLTTLATSLDNARALARQGEARLSLTAALALDFASACEHAAEALEGLPESEEEEERGSASRRR